MNKRVGGPSVEKMIDRIIGHMTLSVILLLFGLIIKDQLGFRGFPFGWYRYPQYVKYDGLVASFIILLAVTICADILSAAIGRVREPAMKEIGIKAAPLNSISSNVKEKKVEKKETVKRETIKETVIKELNTPELKNLLKQTDKGKTSDSKTISRFAALGIALAVLAFSFFAANEDNDYDYDYDDDSYDYEYDAGDNSYDARDVAFDTMEHITLGDYDSLSEIGDTSQLEGLDSLEDYEIEEFEEPYAYNEDDVEQMVYRYILYEDRSDVNADVYLVGVLVESGNNEDPSGSATVTGICFYWFRSYDDYQDYYEDPSRWITPAECYVIGKTEIDGTFILNVFNE